MCKDGTCDMDSHTQHKEQHAHHDHAAMPTSSRSMAVSATLHCITGCAIGEIIGLIAGTALALTNGATIGLAIALSFVFGYSLSMLPLLKNGLGFKKALTIILAADTLSILTMEVIDNSVMALIPNAMNATLVDPLYWISMPVSLIAAFLVAVPVNQFLLQRGKGHALVHEYHAH